MVLGAFRGDVLYDLLLALHIAAASVAFSPAAAHPLTTARVKNAQGVPGVVELSKAFYANTRVVYVPALMALGVVGILLVLVSDEAWEFSDAWIIGSLVTWMAIAGVVTGMTMPGERALAAGDETAEKGIAMGGQLATLGVVVIPWLMVFKPARSPQHLRRYAGHHAVVGDLAAHAPTRRPRRRCARASCRGGRRRRRRSSSRRRCAPAPRSTHWRAIGVSGSS